MTITADMLYSVEDYTEHIKTLEKQIDIIYDEKDAIQNKLNECLKTLHYVRQRRDALTWLDLPPTIKKEQ
jgi:chaperonin cofactor prefoldin